MLDQLLRIGRRAFVSLPNFAHWSVACGSGADRCRSRRLPDAWYETPNIHLCSIRDFVALCDVLAIEIERGYVVDRRGLIALLGRSLTRANLLGQQAVVLLRQNAG